MRQFVPDPAKRKQKEKEKMEKRMEKMERQRRNFDKNTNRGWRAVDIKNLTLLIRQPIPDGFTKSIQLYLNRVLSYREIERRLDMAFGDLK